MGGVIREKTRFATTSKKNRGEKRKISTPQKERGGNPLMITDAQSTQSNDKPQSKSGGKPTYPMQNSIVNSRLGKRGGVRE